jgi:uncharacterized protein YhjY with autotransporter beta-barrel domain
MSVGRRAVSSFAFLFSLVTVLGLFPFEKVFAVGNAATGASTWSTTCTSCHGTPQTTAGVAFPLYGATVNSLSSYANNAAAITTAASTGYSPIPAGNTYPGAAGGNTSTFMAGYLTTLNTVSASGFTNAQDIAAYFATFFSPVLNTPVGGTYASGAAYNNSITGTYLTTNTTYTATLGTISMAGICGFFGGCYGTTVVTFTASNLGTSGSFSGTLPTVSAPTNYFVQLTATNANNVTAGSVTYTITVNPPAPVVSSAATASGTVGVNATQYTITASNTPTSYSVSAGALPTGLSLNTANGAVTGTPTVAGTFTPTLAATNVTGTGTKVVTFTIAKGTQSISFGTAPTTVVVATAAGSVSATATSALAVTYSSATPTQCSVNAGTGAVTGLAAGVGNCTITANQAGDANWNAATPVTQTFSVGKGSQTITFGAAPTVLFNGTGNASASATSGLAITYGTSTPTQCSVSAAGLVTGLAAGASNCTITANQAGDANYNAAVQATQTISIGKASQTIGFGTAPGVVVGGTGTAVATATSGLAVTYSVPVTTTICSVNATTGVVSGLAFGTCTVAANQAGNANYNTAPQATQNIAVGLVPQTITFGAAPAMTYSAAPAATGTVSATASSGLAVTFSSLTTAVCSITGSTVTAVTAGSCTIAANQAGNGTYAAATQTTQSFTIAQAAQSITFGTAPTVTVGTAGNVSATGGASGNAVTFTSQTPAVCSVTGTSVTGVTAGTCIIAANQAGNTNYSAATQVTQNFTVGKGNQTITFGAAPAITVGGTGNASATASSGLAVSYTSQTASVCTVAGSTVTGVNAGSCTIAADQAGNVNYIAAPQATQSFSIGKATQTLSFGAAPAGLVVGGTATISATSTVGLTPSYSSTTPTICTVSGSTVTAVAVGSCTVAANQGGNANYNPATQVTQSFTIGQGSQTITFGTAPAISVGGTGTVSATASSGLTVTFTSQTTGICTVSGSTVSGLVAGTCVIAADQAGSANYSAALQVTQNITVSNLPPTPSPASMSTTLNTAVTLDLTGSITGTGVSGVSIATQPAHGNVTVSGKSVTYTPNQDYFGTDTFTYRAYGLAGVSASAATVTVTITGRPDPLKDARVTGLVNIETAVVKRFDKAQLFNYQQRLESRHHAAYVPSSGPVQTASVGIPAGGAPSGDGQSRGYFNSWQPGTVLEYANDPTTLLNAPDPATGIPGGANAPMYSMMMSMLGNALTSSSLNLGAISNAAGAAQEGSEERLELWAAGNLRFGTRSQAGVDTKFSTDGISVGMDKRMDRHLTVGMGMGYARDKSSIGTDGTNSSASGNSLAGYFSYQRDSGAFFDGLLGYGKVSFDTNRYVTAVNDFARATRKGDQVFGSFSFGYEYRNSGMLWSPYGRFDFSHDRLNEGTESGAGGNALYYASQTVRNSQLGLGMRVQSVHQADFGVVQPRARVEYLRGLEATGQTAISYADLLGTQYQIAATTQNTNSLVLGLGSEFLLSDTLRFTLDYQRLRSPGRENYQSFNFRLTKDLQGKNDLEALLTESYSSSVERPSGLVVAAGFAYDDNVTRASEILDMLSDSINSLMVNKTKTIELSEYTRLTVSGFLDIEKFHTYAGLGHFSGGAQGEYKYRSSGEFGTPTYGIFVRYTADEYESRLRDGSRTSVGVTLRKPVTDRINLYTALSENRRIGRSAVFNTYDVSGRANIDYALARGHTLYLTGEYRKGDIVSTGRSSLAILDVAEVFVRDDVFDSSFFDYRMKGQTTLWTLGYNLSFGPKDSVDLAWRRVESKPNKSPGFAAPPMRYIDNQYSITYLMAF